MAPSPDRRAPEQVFAEAMRRILRAAAGAETLVSALSGGMDSVVLLHLLAGWRARNGGPPALAAHLDHRLRGGESDADREFCAALAQRLGISFAVRSEDVAGMARDNRLGLEEAGRLLRYRFFHSLADSARSVVLTGHHADDQAETILMHIRRGAHRRGMRGMREFTPLPVPPGLTVRVGRPLLGLPRRTLFEYARENGLVWREDASNRDPSYTRNRIRHRVIPTLETLMPGFRQRLLAKAEAMAAEEERLTEAGRRLAEERVAREHGGLAFRLSGEALAEPERLLYAFRHVIEEEIGGMLPYGAVLSRLAVLAESGRLGETLSLPGALRVRRESDGLFFFYPETGSAGPEAECILPDPPFDIVANGLRLTAEWLPTTGMPPPEDRDDPEVEWLNAVAIRWPLCIRPPLPGERFRPIGAPGSRKIHDILMDLKTPRRKRGVSRVLADHAGALWLWPYRLANRAKLTGVATKALRLRIREGEGGSENGEKA